MKDESITLSIAFGRNYPGIRDAVRKVCEPFDGACWQSVRIDRVQGRGPPEYH